LPTLVSPVLSLLHRGPFLVNDTLGLVGTHFLEMTFKKLLRRSIVAVGTLATLGLQGKAEAKPSNAPPLGVAIVTGGGRGIGAACSEALAAKGYGVVIAYRSDDSSADRVCRRIGEAGGKACAVRCDIGVEEDVVKLFSFADSAFGVETPLTVLVNNAGVMGKQTSNLSDCTEHGADDLLELMRTNVAGPLMAIREAEKRMSTVHGGIGGAIVQISSGSAYIGAPLLYAASKGALNSLTIGLVAPLARQNIRINTVSPGMTDTDMVSDVAKSFDFNQIPLGRMGTPQEIANAVVWLCSSEASYVAGANMRVAGGRPPGTTLG